MKKPYTAPILLYTIILFIIWTLLFIALANWKLANNEQTTHELAENQARSNFNKDKAFRLWLTGHGRIYIPVDESYQPDPYLAHIKDRDITTPSGIKLSMINPARIVRELDKQYSKFYGVAGRVTSLTPLRAENQPDDWERAALHRIEAGEKEIFEYTSVNNKPYLRLIQPLPLEKGCLLCHANLVGKTNGVGGGVTISLPMTDLLERQQQENTNDMQLFLITWLIGSAGLLLAYVYLRQQSIEKEKAVIALESSQSRNNAIMRSALDCIITINEQGIVIEANPATEKTFGFQRSALIGHNLAELIIPHNLRDKHRTSMNRLLETGQSNILNTRIETTALHAKGHQFPIELSITRIAEADNTFFTAYLRDLTESHALKEKLTHQASHDALTNLINRWAFESHLQNTLNETDENSQHCLMFLDLDQFKIVNDSNGHIAGDELLRQLSQILQQQKRASDTLARLGGDEFALLLEGCPLENAEEVATKMIEAVQKYHFRWEEKVFSVGLSIGLVPIAGRSTLNASELISDADAACYKAKEEGRNQYHVFQHDDEELTRQRNDLAFISRIQNALQEDHFVLYKQAIQPLDKNIKADKLHCEILLRMQDPDGQIIGPDKFIPAAERYNLMLSIDKWVIEKTFQWLAEQDNPADRIQLCSINLSGYSITDRALTGYIISRLEQYKLPANIICFEITETVAISNLIKASQFMDDLHQQGCQFALDDFGSGVSSFGYLKNLPVDYLKIDGSFVCDITTNPVNLAMVKSINEIGKIMSKKTIAEYVENQETADLLKQIGVDYAQGYIFSRPEPV